MQIKSGCRSSSEVRGSVNEIPASDRRPLTAGGPAAAPPGPPPDDEPLPAQCAASHFLRCGGAGEGGPAGGGQDRAWRGGEP